MNPPKVYEVYDIETDELVVKGTAKECAEKFGVTVRWWRDELVTHSGKLYKGCRIEIIGGNNAVKKSKETEQGLAKAIAAWDAFVTPIRERYGVPVYKGGKSDGT